MEPLALHTQIITAAFKHMYCLEVVSQITGVPQRLINLLVKPKRMHDDVALYHLREVVKTFSKGDGARIWRKLHQHQLELYGACRVEWIDEFGKARVAEGAYVEIRGERAEVTFSGGERKVFTRGSAGFKFSGSRVTC